MLFILTPMIEYIERELKRAYLAGEHMDTDKGVVVKVALDPPNMSVLEKMMRQAGHSCVSNFLIDVINHALSCHEIDPLPTHACPIRQVDIQKQSGEKLTLILLTFMKNEAPRIARLAQAADFGADTSWLHKALNDYVGFIQMRPSFAAGTTQQGHTLH